MMVGVEEIKLEEGTCVKQINTYDCGIHVMKNIESIVEKIEKSEDLMTLEAKTNGMRDHILGVLNSLIK